MLSLSIFVIVLFFREANLNSPCTKAFMDYLFLQTSSAVSTELLLQCCTFILSWARMSFRASKSHSIVIQNGRVLHVSPFSFGRSIDVSLCVTDKLSLLLKIRFCMG